MINFYQAVGHRLFSHHRLSGTEAETLYDGTVKAILCVEN